MDKVEIVAEWLCNFRGSDIVTWNTIKDSEDRHFKYVKLGYMKRAKELLELLD